MIIEIITTYLITVNGTHTLPISPSLHCECKPKNPKYECGFGSLITNGDMLKVVVLSDDEGPVLGDLVVECRQ